jgi:hypothetical protein
MAGVTLGIKNQWGFPVHASRSKDHNFHLARKLVDLLAYVKPDATLIEGIEATIHGHYPPTALADRCVKPMGVLIGGRNVVAVDMVGAALCGLTAAEVDHLRLAVARGLGDGVNGLADIKVVANRPEGNALSPDGKRPAAEAFPTDLYPCFPDDVKIIKGRQLACREGCVNNPLTLLQVLHSDYHGRGGWTLVMGKGFDSQQIDALQGRVLVAGHCAVEEVSERLIQRLGRKNIYLSGECNDLCATAEAMFHLMGVSPLKLVGSKWIRALRALVLAKLHRSNSRVPSPLAHVLKKV